MIWTVRLSKKAQKDLKRVPDYIFDKLDLWITSIERLSLQKVRKIKGYHDEPLLGDRKGQRSIRLSKAYRAIYEIQQDGSIECVEVQEVNKHEY